MTATDTPYSGPIDRHVLRSGDVEISVLSIGCAIQDWVVGGRRMVLGYADLEDYRTNPVSMGVVVGRVVNRIDKARFVLDGTDYVLPANSGENHIHGGPTGLGWRHWDMRPEGDKAVELTLHSPHMDGGYPGAVDFRVRLELDGAALTWDMTAQPDRPTYVNLAQHLYFNLSGTGKVRDHSLRLAADQCTLTRDDGVPTGEILDVAGTCYDFREARRIDAADPDAHGYDLNFVLSDVPDAQAEVAAPDGTRLRLWTDRPGLQVYTSNTLRHFGTPHAGQTHGQFDAICLEAQDFPNAMNQTGFGSVLCAPDAPYRQRTTIEITR